MPSDHTGIPPEFYPGGSEAEFNKLKQENESLRQEISQLCELVAVTNADGGHYRSECGTKAAVDRGIARYNEWARRADAAEHALANARRGEERAYQLLEFNGVPRHRAKSVSNGIDVLVTRMVKENSMLQAELELTRQKVIYGFCEEEYPVFTGQGDAHSELSTEVSAKELNGLVDELKKARQELAEARALKELLLQPTHEESGGNVKNAYVEYMTVPKQAWQMLVHVCETYAMQDTYMGRRTGGVLKGCPRGEPPSPHELAQFARHHLDRVRELLVTTPVATERMVVALTKIANVNYPHPTIPTAVTSYTRAEMIQIAREAISFQAPQEG